MLYPDMTKEAEDLLTDRELKAVRECYRQDHRSYADDRCRCCQANNETGERPLLVKCHPPRNESGNVQIVTLSFKNRESESIR